MSSIMDKLKLKVSKLQQEIEYLKLELGKEVTRNQVLNSAYERAMAANKQLKAAQTRAESYLDQNIRLENRIEELETAISELTAGL